MSTTTLTEKKAGSGLDGSARTGHGPESGLPVSVLFTSIDRTLAALEKARQMAKPFGAKITVIALQVVPYPLPIYEPPAGFEFVVRRFLERAGESRDKMQISAYLCRDPLEALNTILNPESPVVIGIRKKWWPSRDARLMRQLLRAGYDVISVDQE